MKRLILILGLLVTVVSTYSLLLYLPHYFYLSQYEKGIAWGNAILFAIGIFLIYRGRPRKWSQ